MGIAVTLTGNLVFENKIERKTVFFSSETGLIEQITEPVSQPDVEYSEECLVFPGFGDIHIHAREDVTGKHVYKEDFFSAGMAALNGGVVHVADMPNNPVPPTDEPTYQSKQDLTQKSPVHITLYAGIGPETRPLKYPVPYKVFMGPSIGELFFKSNESLEEVIRQYEGQSVSFHCEDPEILEACKSQPDHEDRRPVSAEITATGFALYLIERYRLKGKLCHYSSGEGLRSIIAARKAGLPVTCEVTPTHLFFDRTFITPENHRWLQMNPPLRSPEDRKILLDAVRSGLIDYLATDHAPHSREEKEKGISGVSHLDTYGAFVTWLMKSESVSAETIRKICSENPGQFVNPYLNSRYGLGFGRISPGWSASFSVINFKKPYLVSKDKIKSRSGWSPFEGMTFPGSVEDAWFHGRRRHQFGEF